LLYLTDRPDAPELRRRLGLGPESRALIFSTEGATDPVSYERIVNAGCRPG
jgi:diaminopropionate ammonia-lyase